MCEPLYDRVYCVYLLMDPSSIQLCRSLCCASQVLSPFKVHFLVVGLVRLSLQYIDYDSKTLATPITVGSTTTLNSLVVEGPWV